MAATPVQAAKVNMKKLVTLPYRKVFDGGINAICDLFDKSRFDEVHKLYVDACEKGLGYTQREVERDFLKKKFETSPVLSMTDEATGDILVVMPIFDSYMSRSTKPFLASVYTIVNPKVRGIGIATEQYQITRDYAIDIGFLGGIGRAAITSRNVVPSRKAGADLTAIIPYCTPLGNQGYVDDIAVYFDFHLDTRAPDYFKAIAETHNLPLPAMKRDSDSVKFLHSGREHKEVETKTKSGCIKIRSPQSDDELFEVEGLWRDAAERGRGFGLDEFTDNGYFNRRLFWKSESLIAENIQGDLVGASLFGPSTLSRSANPILSGLYTTVNEKYANQGIATALLSQSLNILKKQGYKGCASDTYTNNYNMLHLLHNFRFTYRGSIPLCAYLKNYGVADTLIVYRNL